MNTHAGCTFDNRMTCMPSDCHALCVYQVWCW